MAQGQGGPTAGGEIDYLGQEEHGNEQEKRIIDFLRMSGKA